MDTLSDFEMARFNEIEGVDCVAFFVDALAGGEGHVGRLGEGVDEFS